MSIVSQTGTRDQRDVLPAAWTGFAAGPWQDGIDVRDFIQRNYTPYTGDAGFLEGPTERTTRMWSILTAMFPEEREKGVYDVDPHTPAGITSHAPGYISKDDELIVGLQTDAPLKRAIMPNGGWRMVEGALETYGYEVDEDVRRISRVPQDPQRGRLRPVPAVGARRAQLAHHHRACPTPTAAAASSATTAAWPSTGWTPHRGEEARQADARHVALRRRDRPPARGARGADARPRGAEGDGRVLRVRHLEARHRPPARPSSGSTSPTSAP